MSTRSWQRQCYDWSKCISTVTDTGGEEQDAYFEYADVTQQCLDTEEFRIASVKYASIGTSVTSSMFWQETVDNQEQRKLKGLVRRKIVLEYKPWDGRKWLFFIFLAPRPGGISVFERHSVRDSLPGTRNPAWLSIACFYSAWACVLWREGVYFKLQGC